MDLNNIPTQGTFGAVINKVNDNFDIIRSKIAEIEALIEEIDPSESGDEPSQTYTNADFGQGYAVCNTAYATAAKTCTLSSGTYSLEMGGYVAIKFANDVCANATLNIGNEGARPIYYKGSAIGDKVIKAGETALFVYSMYYHLIAIDKKIEATSGGADLSSLATVALTGKYSDLVGAPQYVICTIAEYNAMASHDADTYYIIIAEPNE